MSQILWNIHNLISLKMPVRVVLLMLLLLLLLVMVVVVVAEVVAMVVFLLYLIVVVGLYYFGLFVHIFVSFPLLVYCYCCYIASVEHEGDF